MLKLLPFPIKSVSLVSPELEISAKVIQSSLLTTYKEHGRIFAILKLEVETHTRHILDTTKLVEPLIREFGDICVKDMPYRLPPLRDIQHYIDFIPHAQLPNLPHYKLNPTEKHVLNQIVEDLISKELVQPSLCLCVVITLLVPKKDELWRICVDS